MLPDIFFVWRKDHAGAHALLTPEPQAVQKMTGEYYAGLHTRLYGLETACLLYFNVFGLRQDPSSAYSGVISIFMDRTAAGHAPMI